MTAWQQERPWPRDPVTQIIRGAEPFDFGTGAHAVLFVHGWTSTPREMRFLAERVAQAGFRCRGILLKGHGTTLRALSGVEFRDHLEECEEAFAELAMAHERVSLCGLSGGALMSLHVGARRKVANLVLLAPFLRPWGSTWGLPNRWLVDTLPLHGFIAKGVAGPILDATGAKDHIAYHAMPAEGVASLARAIRDFRGRERRIACPTLILHSVHDRTSDFAGSLSLIRDLGSEDKTLVALNRSDHVITLDYDRERVESAIVAWLGKRKTEH